MHPCWGYSVAESMRDDQERFIKAVRETIAMTKLMKKKTIATNALGPDRRPLYVTLYPDGTIGIRQQYERQEKLFTLAGIYVAAARAEAERNRSTKKKEKRRGSR